MGASFLHDSRMKRAIVVALGTGAAITSAAAIGIGATVSGVPKQAMGHHEYQAALRATQASRDHALALCDDGAEAGRDVCRAEAVGASLVRVAELEAMYRRDQHSARALQRARIEARYQVERAQCGAFSGAKRDRCVVRAHAAKGRALLEAAAPYEVKFTP